MKEEWTLGSFRWVVLSDGLIDNMIRDRFLSVIVRVVQGERFQEIEKINKYSRL